MGQGESTAVQPPRLGLDVLLPEEAHHLHVEPRGQRGHLGRAGEGHVAAGELGVQLAVAAHYVEFESKDLKPSFHFIGSRVESPNHAPFKRYGSTEFKELYSPASRVSSSAILNPSLRWLTLMVMLHLKLYSVFTSQRSSPVSSDFSFISSV
jgi:hypothetical protein